METAYTIFVFTFVALLAVLLVMAGYRFVVLPILWKLEDKLFEKIKGERKK